VHLPDGVIEFDDLEQAAAVAIETANKVARAQAEAAGADGISLEHTRHDNIVDNAGERVFFESRIVATAVGRPATLRG